MEIESQRIEYPCCICLDLDEEDILKYCCWRCIEGVVCENCAVGLWRNNFYKRCPVCRNKSTNTKPWYKVFDDNGEYINTPNFETISNNSSNEIDNEYDTFEKVIIFIQSIFCCSMTLFLIFFIGFFTNYLFKLGSCKSLCTMISQFYNFMENILTGMILITIIIFAPIIGNIIIKYIRKCFES